METTIDIKKIKKNVLDSFATIAANLDLKELEDIQDYIEVLIAKK